MSARGGILAIDQGTTNTKALLIAEDGAVVARASRPTTVQHPRPDWAEQDGKAIWQSVAAVIAEIVATGAPIAGVAISNQRETIGLWDRKTGEPTAPFVLWQCRRSSERCAQLRGEGYEPDVVAKTGLALDPMFSAAKLAWLLDSAPDTRERAARGELGAGTVDSWLLWNLTGGVHATDHSNASRTQLMNLDTLEWDPELADLFQTPLSILPQILPSNSLFGHTVAGVTALPAGVPICAIMGDSHAALFGHGFEGAGGVKATCGTGSSLMTVTDRRIWSAHGLSSTVAWSEDDKVLYALEGNILVSGHTVAFITRLLGLENEQATSDLAQTVDDANGVCVVPAFAGLGAPHWQDRARGMICGMSLSTTRAHVARAAFEAIALQIRDVFVAMEADLHTTLPELSVDGGASQNNMLAQMLADTLDRPIRRPGSPELSALGAARMAARHFPEHARPADTGGSTFSPAISTAHRSEILARWRDGLARTTFADPQT